MYVDIRGKWALVTGASRGIGKLVAARLVDLGCNVVLHSRDLAHTRAHEGELSAKGVRVTAVAADLADQADVDRMLDTAIARSGGLDIVYNNAAVMTPFRSPYATATVDDFRLSFEVNVITPVRVTYRVLPRMIEQGFPGRIVQVTSGIQDQPELMAYI